jgi:hypothetical protein
MEEAMSEKIVNRRLERVAKEVCDCVLTDGFCIPNRNPRCRCWDVARAAVRGVMNQSNPAMFPGWEVTHAAFRAKDKADPRNVLNALCEGILTHEDDLTLEAPTP